LFPTQASTTAPASQSPPPFPSHLLSNNPASLVQDSTQLPTSPLQSLPNTTLSNSKPNNSLQSQPISPSKLEYSQSIPPTSITQNSLPITNRTQSSILATNTHP
jgi:hypothetical protein